MCSGARSALCLRYQFELLAGQKKAACVHVNHIDARKTDWTVEDEDECARRIASSYTPSENACEIRSRCSGVRSSAPRNQRRCRLAVILPCSAAHPSARAPWRAASIACSNSSTTRSFHTPGESQPALRISGLV